MDLVYPHQFIISNQPVPFWRNSLLILVGPSGAGKSTFAKKYFPSTMCVSTDFCRSMICDSPGNQKVSDDAFDIFYFIIEKRLKNGYPTVADSTALRKHYRQKLIELADKYKFSSVLMLFDLPEQFCQENDKNRQFSVGENVQNNQFALFSKTKEEILQEKYEKIVVLQTKEHLDDFDYRWTAPEVECTFSGPLDIIGDVHGCCRALQNLLEILGYKVQNGVYQHPHGRKCVFLGDILDRGKENAATLEIVYSMWHSQNAFYIPGNHCNKLMRYFKGGQVSVTEGMETTIEEFHSLSPEAQKSCQAKFDELYSQAQPYLIMDSGRLVVSHAGILEKYLGRLDKKIWSCCLYGPMAMESFDDSQKKERKSWQDGYHGKAIMVHGHIPTESLCWRNNIIDIDLGAGHDNGKLCALRYPEKEFVMVSVS